MNKGQLLAISFILMLTACSKPKINPDLQACLENYEKKNIEAALESCHKAALAGEQEAAIKLARITFAHDDFELTEKILRPVAVVGNAEAQTLLASVLLLKEDGANEAISLLTEASNNGFTLAKNQLGWVYYVGVNKIEPNYEKAFKIYKELADSGDPEGQIIVGFMYLMELGTKADNIQTYTYWKKAYEQGFPAAVPLIEYKDLRDHTGLFSAIKMASSVDETIEYIKWVQEEGKDFLVQKEEIDILPGMKWYYTQSQRGFNYALGMMGFSLIREGSVKEAIDVISQFEKAMPKRAEKK